MEDETFVRGRLKKGLAKDIQEHLTLPLWWSSQKHLFRPFNHINMAHVIMLEEQGILESKDTRTILKLLLDLEEGDQARVQPGVAGEFYLDLERYIINQIGEDVGGKIHTGRSRNDLLATAQRMALREPLDDIIGELLELRQVELELAESHVKTIMPGYTHLQHAQPITLAHYFAGHAYALSRDTQRLETAQVFLNMCPLGAGALAGVTFPIDRHRTADLLGFNKIMENALDAVASRDYAFDITAGLAMTVCDLSRLAEDLYLWNTYEFGFIEIGDEYAEISSIMPQKKNPFVLEHCRGRAGRVFGNVLSLLTTLKGTPFTHSRDVSTEVILPVWEALETASSVILIFPGLLKSLKFKTDRMRKIAEENFSAMTDLVDILVKEKGISFRKAHHIVARIVDRMISEEKKPGDITAQIVNEEAVKTIGRTIKLDDSAIRESLLPESCVERRNLPGGPASGEVKRMIEELKKDLSKTRENLEARKNARKHSEQRLLEAAQQYLGEVFS